MQKKPLPGELGRCENDWCLSSEVKSLIRMEGCHRFVAHSLTSGIIGQVPLNNLIIVYPEGEGQISICIIYERTPEEIR